MNSLIWGTCNTTTSKDQCVANMGWFASTLRTACAQELDEQNSMVLDTLICSFPLSMTCFTSGLILFPA